MELLFSNVVIVMDLSLVVSRRDREELWRADLTDFEVHLLGFGVTDFQVLLSCRFEFPEFVPKKLRHVFMFLRVVRRSVDSSCHLFSLRVVQDLIHG